MATRGRPRTDSIPRFNVDTFLSSNKKSIKFKRRVATVPAYVNNPILTVEEWTWFILARFFNYVNANCAMNAYITDEDAESVAEFCKWQGEPLDLLNHLRDAGFIEADGAVHDQDDHQPLAADIKRKRAQREGNGDFRPDSGEFVPPECDRGGGKLRNTNSNPNLEGKVECIPSKAIDGQAKPVDKSTSPPIPPTPSSAKARSPSNPNGAKIPPEIVMLANDLLSTAHISDRQDRRDIAWDVYHSVKANREEDVHRLISEIRQGEHSQARNIVAVIRSKLRLEPG